MVYGIGSEAVVDLKLQQHVGYEVVGEHWLDCKRAEDGASLPLHLREKGDAREDMGPEFLKRQLALFFLDCFATKKLY